MLDSICTCTDTNHDSLLSGASSMWIEFLKE